MFFGIGTRIARKLRIFLWRVPCSASHSSVVVKIQTVSQPDSTTIKVIGRLDGECIELLKAEIDASHGLTIFEMSEVTLVDVDVVQFLVQCEARGIELHGCSAYIREWISRERENKP